MKTLFRKLRSAIRAGIKGWKQNSFNPPTVTPAIQPEVMSEQTPHSPYRNLQDQLINNEFAAETCTRNHQGIRIIERTSGGAIPASHSHESFTENGLVSNQTDAFMTSADGRLIKPNELHGGGRCFICNCLTNKLEFCAECKRPLCFQHSRIYKGLTVCPEHYRHLEFNDDTWEVKNERQ